MRAAALSEAEVTEAYRRYGALVHRRCLALVRSPALAEDALQEAFLRLWRYGAAFREAEAPLLWLYRVADRCCLDLLRRHGTRQEGGRELPADLPAPGEPGRAVEDRAVALHLLGQLDERTRQVAIHYYLDEMTQEEIAVRTGWSRQTVNKKIGQVQERAAQLRERLGGSGGGQ